MSAHSSPRPAPPGSPPAKRRRRDDADPDPVADDPALSLAVPRARAGAPYDPEDPKPDDAPAPGDPEPKPAPDEEKTGDDAAHEQKPAPLPPPADDQPQHDMPQHDQSRVEPQHDAPQHDVPHHDVPRHDVQQHDVPHHDLQHDEQHQQHQQQQPALPVVSPELAATLAAGYAYGGVPMHGGMQAGMGMGAGAMGPAQTHANSVLVPEVASVLNGLFSSGFFCEGDIDGRAIEFLSGVSPDLALAALEDIQHRDFSVVRSKPAFIFSIFKNVVAAGGSSAPPQAPPGGFPPATVPASALAHLPHEVSDALQRVFASGVCHPSQFDDRAMDGLVELDPGSASRALSEFAAMERGRVRNPSAFWMGLVRKYKHQAQNAGMGGMGMASVAMQQQQNMGGYGGGGGYSPTGGGGYQQLGGAGGGGGYSALDQRLDELANMGILAPDSLDDRAAVALRKLPEKDALSVLRELPDPSRVRNMSAYVMGLCKKFATGEARSLAGNRTGSYGLGGAGQGDVSDIRETLSRMDPDVRTRFYDMVDRGMFHEQAFDYRAMGALQSLSVNEACEALDELAASDPRRINNISAYWMGLAKKFGQKAL